MNITPKDRVAAAFLARKAKIDVMLGQLANMSANHFDVDPDAINWGHVGDLERISDALKIALSVEE